MIKRHTKFTLLSELLSELLMKQVTGDFGRGEAVWWSRGDTGRGLHFLAANGFPVASYRFLLEPLARQHRVLALESRGAWPGNHAPQAGFKWAEHADDLIAFLENQQAQSDFRAVVGIGHSIGATVTAMAALKRPELFERLILIDPATYTGRWSPLIARFRPSRTKGMDLARRTRNRRVHWQSHADFASYHRGKSAYSRFTEQALTDYTQAALRPVQERFELIYDRDWEAWNFQQTAALWPVLRKLKLPTLVLRGEHSSLHPQAEFARYCKRLPANVTAITVPGAGHMLPQEAPDAVLAAINEWLA
ncbi:MAG: pimeloyl-ACP methyl ester carboxylesterase [Paracoccaceae bacterium]|jgi:pimeloyl-ACP methyl ester carboxylesterase